MPLLGEFLPLVQQGRILKTWKDTVRVGPDEEVLLVARFTGHTGTYVFHCHVLEHEDHSMMFGWQIVDKKIT